MSHPLLERHLERRTVKPLYLFYGDEEFLMNRALLRLETGLTDQSGEPPAKVVREAQEVGLAEFLAESREATLWGPGQLLILRRVEAYPVVPRTGRLPDPFVYMGTPGLFERAGFREVARPSATRRILVRDLRPSASIDSRPAPGRRRRR